MKIIIELPCPVEIVSGDVPETLIIRPTQKTVAAPVTVARLHLKKKGGKKAGQRGIVAPAEPKVAISDKPEPAPEKLKGIAMSDEGWE